MAKVDLQITASSQEVAQLIQPESLDAVVSNSWQKVIRARAGKNPVVVEDVETLDMLRQAVDVLQVIGRLACGRSIVIDHPPHPNG